MHAGGEFTLRKWIAWNQFFCTESALHFIQNLNSPRACALNLILFTIHNGRNCLSGSIDINRSALRNY